MWRISWRVRCRTPGSSPPFVSVGQNDPISGSVAAGWADNSSWANVTVTYSADTNNPHSGTAAQMVEVGAVQSGAVQLVQPIVVIPGATYSFRAWLRGQPGMSVNVILQNQNSPYNYYAETPAALTANWQQFTVTGQIDDTGQILLMVQSTTPPKHFPWTMRPSRIRMGFRSRAACHGQARASARCAYGIPAPPGPPSNPCAACGIGSRWIPGWRRPGRMAYRISC